MKKFASILLICVYTLATMGFSLKEFYCCGKLKSTTFTLAYAEKNKLEKDNTGMCCQSKFHYFKLKDNYAGAHHITLPATHFISLYPFNAPFQNRFFSEGKNTIAYRSNAPPLHQDVPIYISTCVFRI